MLSAKQATPRHGTQPSTERRSNRTRAEGWCFGRRSRGHHPSKEGRRPRGATVGDTTFGRRPKACGPGGVRAESVSNHVFACQAKSRSPLRSEWLRQHLRRPRAKASCEAMRREAKWHLQNGGGGSEGLVRSPAKSCEAVPPERFHRRRPSGQRMTFKSGPRNSGNPAVIHYVM